MKKITIGSRPYLYPLPVVLVGAQVQGKANFLTVAYCGIVQQQPAMIAVTLAKTHYTNEGIKASGTFSVNIPSEDMVIDVDHCGMVSGAEQDKSCVFDHFYGSLKTAPMIQECPLNLECRLEKILDWGGLNEVFVGEIQETYVGEEYLTKGLPDIRKIKPILFSMHDNHYWGLGNLLGEAWAKGRAYRAK